MEYFSLEIFSLRVNKGNSSPPYGGNFNEDNTIQIIFEFLGIPWLN